VRVLDRLLYGGEAVLSLTALPGFDLQVGDVRDRAALLRAMTGVDAVIHLAAIVGEAACSIDAAFAWSVNHGAIATLIDTAQEAGTQRLLFVSTCSNYGVSAPNAIVDESASLNPLSGYARAKVLAEQAVLAANRVPIVTVLRLGTICGVASRMRFDLLVNELARDATLGRSVDIYAPAAWRPFLHIDDAAEAMERVLTAAPESVNRRLFNVVGENYQKSGLLEIVRRLRPDIKVTIVDRKPDMRDYRVSGERFVRALSFRPARSIESAFLEVAAAVRVGLFRDPDWPGHSAVPLCGFPTARADDSSKVPQPQH